MYYLDFRQRKSVNKYIGDPQWCQVSFWRKLRYNFMHQPRSKLYLITNEITFFQRSVLPMLYKSILVAILLAENFSLLSVSLLVQTEFLCYWCFLLSWVTKPIYWDLPWTLLRWFSIRKACQSCFAVSFRCSCFAGWRFLHTFINQCQVYRPQVKRTSRCEFKTTNCRKCVVASKHDNSVLTQGFILRP